MVECNNRSEAPSFESSADALDGRVSKCKDGPIAGILRGTPQFQFIRACLQPGFGFDRDPIARLPLQLDRPVAAIFRGRDVECREIRRQFKGRQATAPRAAPIVAAWEIRSICVRLFLNRVIEPSLEENSTRR